MNDPNFRVCRNHSIALYFVNFIDTIKDIVEKELSINLQSLEKEACPPVEEEGKKKDLKSFCSKLGATNQQNKFNQICVDIIKNFNIPESSIPSFYKLIKNRPPIVHIMVKPQDFFKPIDNSLLLNSIDVNNTEENELSQTLSVSSNEMFASNNKILIAAKIEGK